MVVGSSKDVVAGMEAGTVVGKGSSRVVEVGNTAGNSMGVVVGSMVDSSNHPHLLHRRHLLRRGRRQRGEA